MKLGLKPPTEDSRDLRFRSYLTKRVLPPVPKVFGHDTFLPRDQWGMLGNDQYGDCVWAGSAHEHMLLNHAAGRTVEFSTASVLGDYSAVTGFDPGDPSTDQGTDMRDAARYRQKHGIVDKAGQRHKIGAYVWLEPGDLRELLQAVYLFGTVGIGIDFPSSAFDQFEQGKAWKMVKGSSIQGGHYVPVVGRHGTTSLVTWGRRIQMTKAFYEEYCSAAVAYVTVDALNGEGKSPEGFDTAALAADLAAL